MLNNTLIYWSDCWNTDIYDIYLWEKQEIVTDNIEDYEACQWDSIYVRLSNW
jgi:hypothetical protein